MLQIAPSETPPVFRVIGCNVQKSPSRIPFDLPAVNWFIWQRLLFPLAAQSAASLLIRRYTWLKVSVQEVLMPSPPKRAAKGHVSDHGSALNKALSPDKRRQFAQKANQAYEKKHPEETNIKKEIAKNKAEREAKSVVYKLELVLFFIVLGAILFRVVFMD
ncbi:hypothetical protein [Pseudoalteromonas rubra]|nr:hypothetical protein [Pseudoalteromonas rubra]